ncbi:enoyl-CoA hydratase/isomerase family protein [Sphingobacterium sp. Mn56C]|uniref:enoyl-CoA hydratase/isomerase family protein n=1 Tax=Sphingobacterium sp. Mn56C TaxID=3395261 RepID=UPI003BE3B976
MENYSTILVSQDGKTAIITLNRPDKMNALNAATFKDIIAALEHIQQDAAIGGVIITGAGEKAFIAGADIQEFEGMTKQGAIEKASFGHEQVMNRIQAFPKPIIAAINGFALGGGLELALACHIRVAVPTAKLGLPEVSLGLIPGYGGTQRLTQLVGRGRALEIILTGDMIPAEQGLNWGLLNHIYEKEALISGAKAILERIYLRSPHAVGSAIAAVNTGIIDPVAGNKKEIDLFGSCFEHAEGKEGIAAFLEKRKPNFP